MIMTGFPVLSVITWAPFVGALLIMFTGPPDRRSSCAGSPCVSTGVSLVLSIAIYAAYDREAAGFQFYEELPLVPALGINYQLGVDGMSLLMVLLTSIIIFAGSFASWTVKERSQEFYALLLILVTGVYGVFVSLDLFVLFLFYEIAVLPMYLLIGIWGSSGEVRPAGHLRLGVRPHRRGHQGVRGDEADPVPALRVGLHPGRASSPSTWPAGSSSFSFLEMELAAVRPAAPVLGLPRLLRGLRHPGRHLAAPHVVSRRPRLRARPRSPCSTPASS